MGCHSCFLIAPGPGALLFVMAGFSLKSFKDSGRPLSTSPAHCSHITGWLPSICKSSFPKSTSFASTSVQICDGGHHRWFPSPSFLHIELWQLRCLNRSFLPLCGLHPEEGVPNCEELQQLRSTKLQLVCWEESWNYRHLHRRLDDNLLHGSSQRMFANCVGGSIDRGLFGTVPCSKFHCHILDMSCWTCLGVSSLAATTGQDESHWRRGSCEHWAPIADDVGGSSLFSSHALHMGLPCVKIFHPQCLHSRRLLEDSGFAALGTWPWNVLLHLVLHDLLRHASAQIPPTIFTKTCYQMHRCCRGQTIAKKPNETKCFAMRDCRQDPQTTLYSKKCKTGPFEQTPHQTSLYFFK